MGSKSWCCSTTLSFLNFQYKSSCNRFSCSQESGGGVESCIVCFLEATLHILDTITFKFELHISKFAPQLLYSRCCLCKSYLFPFVWPQSRYRKHLKALFELFICKESGAPVPDLQLPPAQIPSRTLQNFHWISPTLHSPSRVISLSPFALNYQNFRSISLTKQSHKPRWIPRSWVVRSTTSLQHISYVAQALNNPSLPSSCQMRDTRPWGRMTIAGGRTCCMCSCWQKW